MLNIRRLMYQSLIWPAVAGNEAGGLGAALDAEDVERAANALVDRVGRDIELRGDLFRGKVLVDEPQAIELARAQPRDTARDEHVNLCRILRSRHGVGPELLPNAINSDSKIPPSQYWLRSKLAQPPLIHN